MAPAGVKRGGGRGAICWGGDELTLTVVSSDRTSRTSSKVEAMSKFCERGKTFPSGLARRDLAVTPPPFASGLAFQRPSLICASKP